MPHSPPHERSPLPKALRQLVLRLLPQRYHVPLRYHYRRWFRTLDPEFRYLPMLVGRGGTAIDVGANLGVYTYALSRLCRNVEAFDPVPEYADLIRAMDAKGVRVHRVALSSGEGTRKLYLPRDRGEVDLGRASLSPPPRAPQPEAIDVPVRTLDAYPFADVSFIKIDVEGHELEVLKGAARTLAEHRPNLLVEIEQRHLPFPMSVVLDHLHGLGYRGWFVEGKELRPIAEFSYERHQEPLLGNVYSKGYVNNFVFLAE